MRVVARGRVAARAGEAAAAPMSPPRPRRLVVRARRSFGTALPVRLLAGLTVLGLLAGSIVWHEQRLREVERLSELSIDRLAETARGRAGTRLVSLTTVDGDPVPVFVEADGRAYLDGSSLPVLAGGRTYQLWGATADERVSLAVLGDAPGVEVFRLPDAVGSLSITVEVEGGVGWSGASQSVAFGTIPR